MSFFDEDPFEDIMNEFFRESPLRRERQFISGEDEDRIIDFIEDEERVYLIFELPGFNQKDISVNVVGRDLEVSAKKSNNEVIQDYLNQKLKQGILIQKKLPYIINTSSINYHTRNGVLEIIFNKQKEVKNGSRKIKID